MRRNAARRAALVVMALALWLGAAVLASGAGDASVELRWDDWAITRDAFDEARAARDTPICAALWRASHGQAKGIHEARVLVAQATGDLRLLAGDALIDGHVPLDEGACALSSAAARTLFGDENVLGREVILDGKALVVHGVYRAGQGDVLTRGAGKFDRLRVAVPGLERDMWLDEATAFSERCGAGAPDERLDFALVGQLARAVAGVPGWLLAFLLIYAAWRAVKRARSRPRLVCGAALALGFAGLGGMLRQVLIPRALLPTRWSDFAFWSDVAEKLGARVRDTFAARHYALDARCAQNAAWVMGLAICAVCAACALGAQVKKWEGMKNEDEPSDEAIDGAFADDAACDAVRGGRG
ncbi:MAG: ABC transporter permease [Clostridia bacterium]